MLNSALLLLNACVFICRHQGDIENLENRDRAEKTAKENEGGYLPTIFYNIRQLGPISAKLSNSTNSLRTYSYISVGISIHNTCMWMLSARQKISV